MYLFQVKTDAYGQHRNGILYHGCQPSCAETKQDILTPTFYNFQEEKMTQRQENTEHYSVPIKMWNQILLTMKSEQTL